MDTGKRSLEFIRATQVAQPMSQLQIGKLVDPAAAYRPLMVDVKHRPQPPPTDAA